MTKTLTGKSVLESPAFRYRSSAALRLLVLAARVGTLCVPSCPVLAQCDVEESAQIIASDAEYGDEFGTSVSVSGSTAVIGAPDDYVETGAVYVYDWTGSAWSESAKITASDGYFYDGFGSSIAIDGDTLAVGAPYDDDGGHGAESGSVYIFKRNGDSWIETHKIIASDNQGLAYFGDAVALDGTRLIVGAWGDDAEGAGSYAGAAYILEYDALTDSWDEKSKLTATDSDAFDYFGDSVDISGDRAIVGAWANDDAGEYSGAAYLFMRAGDEWASIGKITPSDAAAEMGFGRSVAIEDGTVLVGADSDTTFEPERAGAVYQFEEDDITGDWDFDAKWDSPSGDVHDRFGFSVALDGDKAIVGASGTLYPGTAYVYSRSGDTWSHALTATASTGDYGDRLGAAVAIDGSRAIVGAPYNDDEDLNAGSAYEFDADASCSDLNLTVENLVHDEDAIYTVTGGDPGEFAAVLWSLKLGTFSYSDRGWCVDFGLKLTAGTAKKHMVGSGTFDSTGTLVISRHSTSSSLGMSVHFQAAQKDTCPDIVMSNIVSAVVE